VSGVRSWVSGFTTKPQRGRYSASGELLLRLNR
jgi:hypothetical protein